ncbi:34453_t:CDS:2, partial [Gigaspora margarita]
RWVSIYDTMNSIMRVRPAIDKILKEQLNIFTNKDVYEIAFDEDEIFYTSCKKLALVFEPIKQVINFLESRTANLADCFIGIAQIATAFNNICELAVHYYQNLHHNDKECHKLEVVEDEHTHLQELAKTMFAIAPFQANCKRNFSLLKWFKLNFYNKNFEEAELYSSVVNETIFAEDLTATNIIKVLQDLVDLSDPIFGASNKEKITLMNKEETTMEFD